MATEPATHGRNRRYRAQRRRCLQLALAGLLGGTRAPALRAETAADSTTETQPLFISGARQGQERFAAVVFDAFGTELATIPLEARAHGAAAHAGTQRACLFARRPGLYLHTFDRRSPQQTQLIRPVAGRHFYGHGCYDSTGRLLFATENDFEHQRGVLGVYEASNGYRRVAEIDTGGIGPHEVVRVPGSPLLVVANGGILTHPDSGRDKLNLATMAPSVSIIDARDGRLLARHELPPDWHQVSLRHLAMDRQRNVWFGGQYEGDRQQVQGLAGRIAIDQSLQSYRAGSSSLGLTLIDIPSTLQQRMAHYVSSVAVCGDQVLFTAARGSLVMIVDRATARLQETLSVRDCSGVCPLLPGEALLTSGTGEILALSDRQLQSLTLQRWQWDNHVYPI